MMEAGRLASDIKKGKIHRVYHIYGDEEFLKNEAIDMLVRNLVDKESMDFNYTLFYAGDSSIEDIAASVMAYPAFAERRVVLVRELQKLSSADEERLAELIGRIPASTVLILESASKDSRKKLYKGIEKAGISVEFKKLFPWEVEKWLPERLKRMGVGIWPDALRMLIDLTGPDLERLIGEVEKIRLYKGDDDSKITAEDVEKLVGRGSETVIFDLLDMIGERRRRDALSLLNRLFNEGNAPAYILFMMARHIRELMRFRLLLDRGMPPAMAGERMKLRSFQLKKYEKQVKNFSADFLADILKALLDADLKMKSSNLDPKVLLEYLILTDFRLELKCLN